MNSTGVLALDFVKEPPPAAQRVGQFPGWDGDEHAVVRAPFGPGLATASSQATGVVLVFEPAPPDAGDSVRWTRFTETIKIGWIPGKIFVDGAAFLEPKHLCLVAEFAYYEAKLREIETAVHDLAKVSPSDVSLAYRPRWRDRGSWPRLQAAIEEATRWRLRYARLESFWEKGNPQHPRDHQRLITKLLRRAGTPGRAGAIGERLESLEDLYEGANDRVAEYRWFLSGTVLEIAIVVLLVVEAALMGADIYLRTK